MTIKELQSHPTVTALAEIQETLGLKDIPFASQLRLKLHGANWGKIKSGTFDGRADRALVNLAIALEQYQNQSGGEVEDGIVILDHVRQALDLVTLARTADDEHRLVVIVGVKGSGKTRTLKLIQSKCGGYLLSARQSWGGAYLNFLNQFATGLGITTVYRSQGEAEVGIIDYLAGPERLGTGIILIDEFNYFSSSAINFLKTILNETMWVLATATIPYHLSQMASSRATYQEAGQLLRRAVAIHHIPAVSVRMVDLVATALFPHLDITGSQSDIATAANQINRLDSVIAILRGTDPDVPGDVTKSIARHRRFTQISLDPKSA